MELNLFFFTCFRYHTQPVDSPSEDDSRPIKSAGRHHTQPITDKEKEESERETSPKPSIADR